METQYKEDLFRIRKEFELDSSYIKNIISDKEFKTNFFGFYDRNSLKLAPTGFDKNHPNIDLIKKKDFIFLRKFTDQQVISKDFHSNVINSFKTLLPFLNYMSVVLATNLNGETILEG